MADLETFITRNFRSYNVFSAGSNTFRGVYSPRFTIILTGLKFG